MEGTDTVSRRKRPKVLPIVALIIGVSMMLGVLLVGMVCLPADTEGAWQSGGGFDANVQLTYSPTNPMEMQAVNVTVNSYLGQTIYHAVLYVWYTLPTDQSQRYGGYEMTKINSTFRYQQIDGYMAGTEVEFQVTVSDGNTMLESQKYSYTVQATQTWKYSNFAQNMDLTWGPSEPRWDENVTVTIASRDLDVQVFRADMEISVEFPGIATQTSTISMEDVDGTRYEYSTSIPVYPGGTRVTIKVTAYDMLYTAMVSPPIAYTVQYPPTVFIYNAYVIVFDNGTQQYVGTEVTFSNETWSMTGMTTNGMFYTPTILYPGYYDVEIVTEEGNKTQKYYVPNPSANNSYWFYINEAEDISTPFEDEVNPGLAEIIALVLISLMIPLFIFARRYFQSKRTKRADEKIVGKGKKDTGDLITDKGPIAKLKKMFWDDGERKQSITTAGAFLLLGAAGATFAPFYPWWLIILLTITVAAVAYKFPYLSLIILSFIVIGSTAYQKPEFGWLFMIFALGVCIASLFDWRFGYMVFLTVFTAQLGIGFLVPIAAAMLFPLFLAMTITVVAGIFLTLMITNGTFNWFGFFTFQHVDLTIITFSRAAPKSFGPTEFIRAVASIRHINLEALGSVLTENMSSVLPIIVLLVWCLMVLGIWLVRTRYKEEKWTPFAIGGISLVSVVVPSTLMYYLAFNHSFDLMGDLWLFIVCALTFPATLAVFYGQALVRDGYSEYYGKKETNVNIGTRISEMMSFRRTSFDMVGGLIEVKSELKNTMIGPLLRPDIARQYGVEPPRGIIMFGPPGCGKTLLMRTIASELDVEMIGVKCSDVMSKWYGESENLLNTLFQAAKEKRPCILFLDEIDAIAKRRDFYSADDVTPRLLSIMLSEMDGMDEASGIIIIGATNKPELIDPALMRPGRFDKIIYVPPPDHVSRLEILKIHMKGKPIAKDVDVAKLAELTGGYSGADLTNLVSEAAAQAMRRSIKSKKKTEITMSDFQSIISIIKPSLTEKMTREYDELRQEYERKSKDRDGGVKFGDVKLSDLGGIGKLKEFLMELGRILTNPDLSQKLGINSKRGLFMFGPPGNGKSTAIEALSVEYKIPLHRFSGSKVKKELSSDEGMGRLKEAHKKAVAQQPTIVLFENVETFSNDKVLGDRKYNVNYDELLTMMDTVPRKSRVLYAATSQRPDKVDPAFVTRTRFPSIIHMGLPDIAARNEILQSLCADAMGPAGMDTMLVALKTEGFSARDLRSLVDEAKLALVERQGAVVPSAMFDADLAALDSLAGEFTAVYGQELILTSEDLLDALQKVSPTTSGLYLDSAGTFAMKLTEEDEHNIDDEIATMKGCPVSPGKVREKKAAGSKKKDKPKAPKMDRPKSKKRDKPKAAKKKASPEPDHDFADPDEYEEPEEIDWE